MIKSYPTFGGIQLLNKLMATEKPLLFVKAELGGGECTLEEECKARTGLVTYLADAVVDGVGSTLVGEAVVTVHYDNKGLNKGLLIKEIGLYARDPETEEDVLFSYTTFEEDYDWIAAETSGRYIREYEIITVVADVADVRVVYEENGERYVLKGEMQQKLDELKKGIDGLDGDAVHKEDLEKKLTEYVDKKTFESYAAGRHGRWFDGTGITGTNTEGCVFVDSGVEAAQEGDFFLNTETGNVYRCTVAGAAKAAKWVYEGNIRGTGSGAGGTNWPVGGVPLGVAWHTGIGVTGTSPEGTAFPGSGVAAAKVDECYLNTDTGNVYRCVEGGNAATAKWQYVMCIRGPEGEAGLQGNVNVSFGTTDLEDGVSSLENGLMYFVYEGVAAVRVGLPMDSLIGVPLAAGAVALAPTATWSDASTVWYDGEGVTGTPGVGTAYPGSGVAEARVGDFYKNSSTGRLYRCVQGGGPEAALWAFLMDLHGKTGPKGTTGGLYVQIGTEELTPGESELEAGKFYFVYDGQGVVSEARSWYASMPIAASEESGGGSYHHAGSVATYAALPEEADIGDVYDVQDTGMNYRWDGSRWDELGARQNVATDAEVDAMLDDAFSE